MGLGRSGNPSSCSGMYSSVRRLPCLPPCFFSSPHFLVFSSFAAFSVSGFVFLSTSDSWAKTGSILTVNARAKRTLVNKLRRFVIEKIISNPISYHSPPDLIFSEKFAVNFPGFKITSRSHNTKWPASTPSATSRADMP